MLVPIWLYKGLLYGALASVVLSLVYYAYLRKEPQPGDLPKAELARGVPRWRRALAWLPAVMFFGGAFGAWLVYRSAVDVVHVHDVDGRPVARRMKHLGEPSYAIVPGEAHADLVGYDTWVVNESSRPVRIVLTSYGRTALAWGPSPPTVIPPGLAVRSTDVDHIGPTDRPPAAVSVEGFQAKVGVASRTWLTWDGE